MKKLECFHCGEDCKDDSINIGDKLFCCQGCKIAYQILNEADLCTYYDIDEDAGVSLKGRKKEQFSYLDDAEIVEQLVDFSNGEISKVTFHIPSIHCASCLWLLENLYRLNENILRSRVNFLKKEVYLTYKEKELSLRQMVELLDSIGYSPSISLKDLDKTEKKLVERSFYYKVGYAFFAFGNIMLMSFPEYLGLNAIHDSWLRSAFGYINILLALPVVFFSGFDYLRSAWVGLRKGDVNIDVPISIGILSIFFRSVYEILTQSGAGFLDSLAGLVFFLLIGKWFQQKTYYRLSFERDYKSYFPIAATVKDKNGERQVSVKKLEPGDTILIKNNELITADGILLKGSAKIDYSFVTGESEPVPVNSGDKVFAGGKQLGKTIEVTLTTKVSQSYLTQLWNDDTFKENKVVAHASKLADKIGKYFTFVVLSVATLTLIYWLPKDITKAINAFSAVLIIACPCAVAISIPFTFGNVLRVLARNKFYLKNTNVIEAIQKVNYVIFDKTGTITKATENEINFSGNLTSGDNSLIKSLVHHSSHPLSRQIDLYLKDENIGNIEEFEEITGQGVQGKVNGHLIKLGSKNFIFGENDKNIEEEGVFVQIDGNVKGHFKIKNQYRSRLKETMDYFSENYKVALLSGDNDKEKTNLLPYFKEEHSMLFNQSPHDKLEFSKKVQADGNILMMIGDGLNDAGALQQSHVGIVVTENINNFTPACDAIIDAGEFENLPKFLLFAKKSLKLVIYAYFIALIYNIIGLSFAVQGTLSPIIAAVLMPLSSITIAIFGVLSSNFLALKYDLFKSKEKEAL